MCIVCIWIHMIVSGIQMNYKSYPEKEQLAQYQSTILSIFQLKEFDAELLTSKICSLYTYLKTNNYIDDKLCNMLSKKANEVHNNDTEMGFLLLYSFDNCDAFHPCIEKAIQGIYDHKQFREEILSLSYAYNENKKET